MTSLFISLRDNSHGRFLLSALVEAGMPPAAVFVGSPRLVARHRLNGIRRHVRSHGVVDAIHRSLYRLTRRRDVLNAPTGLLPIGIAEQAAAARIAVHRFDALSRPETVAALASYRPDWLLLGGAPLVGRTVLQLPASGTLNAHPGKLPEARGVDVVAWSLIEGVPLGVTVFLVESGVDTGPVVLFEPYQRQSGEGLEQIQFNLERLAGPALVTAIQRLEDGSLQPIPQDRNRAKLFGAMPSRRRIQVDQLLRG